MNGTKVSTDLRFAALPVLETDVPSSLVSSVKNKYGDGLYDITGLKNSSGQDVYMLRILENGQIRNEYVSTDGSVASK